VPREIVTCLWVADSSFGPAVPTATSGQTWSIVDPPEAFHSRWHDMHSECEVSARNVATGQGTRGEPLTPWNLTFATDVSSLARHAEFLGST